MLGLSTAQLSLWAATYAIEVALFLFLFFRRQYRDFPFFSAYIVGVLVQNTLLFFSYSHWGFDTPQSSRIAWASQAFVVLLRALVAMELCHRLVGRYAGIWALTWRVLAAFAAIILAYCLFQPAFSIPAAIVSAHRGVELTIATVVVVVFFFANYYGIIPQPRIKFLAAGLCLYSCFSVINDSFLERWLKSFSSIWNMMATLSFVASMALWLWGFRAPATSQAPQPTLLPADTYKLVSPQLNLVLRRLNDRLSIFWQIEQPGPRL